MILPGCEVDQEREQQKLDGDAWYEDPSYADRVIEREWEAAWCEYLAWRGES